jgi:hypothetical protein
MTNAQPKDNIQKCKHINGAYNKKLWEVTKWDQTNNLSLVTWGIVFEKWVRKTPSIKKNLFDNKFFASRWKPYEFSIKSLTPFAYKLNVKQQKGPLKHLVDHTIFDLHINQRIY